MSLVTWNLLHGANEQGALNLEAKGRYLRGLQADLTFLQEIDRGCRRTGAVDQMQVLGAITQQRPAFASFMDYQGGEYGLGMLTGLPAFEPLALRLPDGDEPRAALLWEVEVEGERLLCVNVHFNWVEDDGARFAQATALLAVLATRGGACIVAGDFNDRPGSRTLAAFQAAGFRHADPHGPTWNAREPSKDIDHVLIRSGAGLALESLGGAILDGDLLSDHRAVNVRLRVRRSTGGSSSVDGRRPP
ncbi:MAG: endonuclease/exonuclease/phosphatase family protein [Planctomycetes bacterium]|nr:endonuclease/exonuclease/phosphatase family protein [Planctomycetota bacterium]